VHKENALDEIRENPSLEIPAIALAENAYSPISQFPAKEDLPKVVDSSEHPMKE
jgi:hypothetical protein